VDSLYREEFIHILFTEGCFRDSMSRTSVINAALILIKWVGKTSKRMRSQCLTYPPGRVLRYLATNHIFREVSPDVFANNRISSVLDTGKSVATIQAE
jgi:hypothetical protein